MVNGKAEPLVKEDGRGGVEPKTLCKLPTIRSTHKIDSESWT
jgi:hypothetical protein